MQGTGMACAERIDQTHPMAKSFAEAKAALDEVFRFYKWRRHTKDFPEEVYLLFSRCAYICFSLWRYDQKSDGDVFRRSPPPMAFWIGLDFSQLQGAAAGAMSLEDPREDNVRNNTQWFGFWMKILEQSDPRGAPIYQEFTRQILACVGHHNWLKIKAGRRSRKTLRLFLQRDEAGRILLRTLSVLEDVVQAILRYFATLDGRTCVLEKITVLTGLLSEMRQIIVWETSACGPYTPSGDAHWRVRSPLTWLSRDRTQGTLTVIPRREGGETICIYSPPSHPKGRRFSWVRKVTSLKGTYEEALFATWSYDTGEHRKNPQQFPGITAHWTVQYAEAQRLETLSRQVDLLLAALQGNPRCNRLVETVRRLLRNGSPRWKNTELPWTYVQQLDQLLEELTRVFREASTSGGDNVAERIIAQKWAAETPVVGAEPSPRPSGQNENVSRGAVSQDVTFALRDVKFVLPKASREPLDTPPQPSGLSQECSARPSTPQDRLAVQSPEVKVETMAEQPPEQGELPEQNPPAEVEATGEKMPEKPESPGEDSRAEGPAPAHADSPASAASDDLGAPERPPAVAPAPCVGSTEADATPAVAPAAPEESAPKPAPRKRATKTSCPNEITDALLQRLLEHHKEEGGTVNCAPLSVAELQRDLRWNPSKIQRALTIIFGPKPVSVYRSKCQDCTIAIFLKTRAVDVRRSAREVALM